VRWGVLLVATKTGDHIRELLEQQNNPISQCGSFTRTRMRLHGSPLSGKSKTYCDSDDPVKVDFCP
jgi:hypothetical protein